MTGTIELENMFKEIERLTDKMLEDPNEDTGTMLMHLMEEVGEFSTAVCIEDGSKVKGYKKLDEPSYSEAVDMFIVVASLFFKRGGTMKDFKEIAFAKLQKWENKL